MGLTERHWFENEDVPESYEWALEDAVYNSRVKPSQIGKIGEVGMTDKKLIKAELQNLQKMLEAKADMCIGNGKEKLLSFANACSGALELLKEEESKQIIRIQVVRGDDDGRIKCFAKWFCPHCKSLIQRGYATPWIKYCYKCGKAVKWKDDDPSHPFADDVMMHVEENEDD